MKKVLYNLAFRTVLFLLTVISVAVAVFSGTVCVLSAYSDDLSEEIYNSAVSDRIGDVQWYYQAVLENDKADAEYYRTMFEEASSNLAFTIYEGDLMVLENYTVDEYLYKDKYGFSVNIRKGEDKHGVAYLQSEETINDYLESLENVVILGLTSYDSADGGVVIEYEYYEAEYHEAVAYVYLSADLKADDVIRDKILLAKEVTNWAQHMKFMFPVCTVTGLICIILLVFCAGHKNGTDGIHLTWLDNVPFDLTLLICGLLGVLGIGALDILLNNISSIYNTVYAVLVLPVLAALAAIVLYVVLTFSARIKAKTLFSNTVVFKLLKLLKRLAGWLLKTAKTAVKCLPLYWQAALAAAAVLFVEVLLTALAFDSFFGIVLLVFEKIMLLSGVVYIVTVMRNLQKGAEEIASGNLDYQVDLRYMFGPFKQHGEQLNSMRACIRKAAEQQLKSERMKAELITNVSHDIKTPLTSIISYVDLLKSEPIESEKCKEYIDVLDRQSARLKKLVTDLVDASKASTGNIKVNLAPADVNVLLVQAVSEYEQKLKENDLEVVLSEDESSPVILADGNLMWRVFDNLINNICKYALSGTRVYISSKVTSGKVQVCFKNISGAQLNISGDELMERFVRGDKSRNTEGSGLGLSISRSLVTLQGGAFDIVVDGDLFKAIVEFDLCKD